MGKYKNTVPRIFVKKVRYILYNKANLIFAISMQNILKKKIKHTF